MAESDKKMTKREIQVELEAMWFAAGTAVFMACFERGILVLSFFEQWRVLMFLALNLLLLAILFTSTRPIFSSKDEINQEEEEEAIESELEDSEKSIECKIETKNVEVEEKEEVEEEIEQVEVEELNERVEAFIAMFRQHLASDGKVNSSFSNVYAGDDNVYNCRAAAAAVGSKFTNCRTSNPRRKDSEVNRTVGSCI